MYNDDIGIMHVRQHELDGRMCDVESNRNPMRCFDHPLGWKVDQYLRTMNHHYD